MGSPVRLQTAAADLQPYMHTRKGNSSQALRRGQWICLGEREGWVLALPLLTTENQTRESRAAALFLLL